VAAAPFPFEDAEAPPRELAGDPFLLVWRALELLALLREDLDLACEPFDLLRAFVPFEPREDAREDLADEDFR
jgi:hypothetical protein